MSTATKLWLGFGLLVLFLIATGLFVRHRISVTEEAIGTAISVQEPAAAIAYEMALNVSASDADVLAHVSGGGREHRLHIAANRAEFANLVARYHKFAPTQMSESLANRLRDNYASVGALGDSLMDLSDEQRASAGRFERRTDGLRSVIVTNLRSGIDPRSRDGQRKLAEVTQLEADVNGIAAALGLYLIQRQPAMRERVGALARDLHLTLLRYRELHTEDAERNDLDRIAADFPGVLALARETMDRTDGVSATRDRFIDRSGELERLVDDGLHSLARTDLVDAQDLARQSLRVSKIAISILIVAGILIAIVTAFPAGLGIVRAERELRRRMNELADAHARKDEFLDVLGHELRNPLAPLANALPLLRARRTDVPEDVRRVHGMIERQTRSMVRIVGDLLDVSRINHGKIELRMEPLALDALVAQSVEDLRPLAQQQGHTLRVRLPIDPLWVNGDATRLSQVIANLVHNAIKYTPRDGTIEIVVRGDLGRALVQVIDTGVGIPREMLPRIFEPFAQVEASLQQSHGGLGIGLTLVERLARMHGGSVTAESPGEGLGSTFTLSLPRIEAPADSRLVARAPTNGAAVRDGSAPSRRILVVDDNRDSAQSMADLLRLWGHEVHLAYDGNEALVCVEKVRPQVVLLDIGLPGLDGYQVADRLRKETDARGLTLVAMTGYGQREDEERAEAAGFDHHLTKPVDLENLKSLLNSTVV